MMTQEFTDSIAAVYGDLLHRHRLAMRAEDEALRVRLFSALDLVYELWPTEIAALEARWGLDK